MNLSTSGITFNETPKLLSTLNPSSSDDLTTKKYVDDKVSSSTGTGESNGKYIAGTGIRIDDTIDTPLTIRMGPDTAVYLNFIMYDNNLFVAAGNSGVIVTSQDGISWTKQTSNVSLDLNQVIYANNQFVVIGTQGTIVTSPDGTVWTAQTLYTSGELLILEQIKYINNIIGGNFTTLRTIVYGKDLYVAIGDKILTSSDYTT
jgi:hypothetical protein